MYRRFYAPPESIREGKVAFAADESRHMTRSLRLGRGDLVLVFDGRGREYLCRISSAWPCVEAEVIEEVESAAEPRAQIELAQALIKGDKFDLVVQKATEVGVASISPLITDRSDVKLPPERANARLERWRRIAREAAKQCRRASVPEVRPVATLQRLLENAEKPDLRLLFSEQGGESLRLLLASRPRRIGLLVGPEGGWSEREIELAMACGARPVTLGPRILRAETAGIIAVALVNYELEAE